MADDVFDNYNILAVCTATCRLYICCRSYGNNYVLQKRISKRL